ncbi:DUF3224 domain-containing protein [Saccharothrix algeriensis]|uniref:DUF3224 domain-containing protein n=1 Tax=Saccharothrix algeriensis TaxID=173560 RepID=A0A8T8HUT0_9PSEU|nr:DUF3224 domain-containing protein [Saccharothrix algeriensis]MBM7813903.1 hypothetical protein [Saccharothrix algeriensis]QTR02333.1 DUF3224 domain-containing protein [Saccharothrix algeriensis]
MENRATGTAEMKSWDEHTWDGRRYDEVTGPKQTAGGMACAYRGALEGSGEMRFVMSYADDASCRFTGYEVVTGVLSGRAGTFVLEHVGGFGDGMARSAFTVVSATADLTGLTGNGTIEWPPGETGRYSAVFELP